MRIAYLGQMADVATENGISKKIRAQCLAWREAGHEVRYFSLAPTAAVWPGMQPVSVELCARGNPGQRIVNSFRLARRIEAWQPEAIYFRYAYHSPGLVRLFRAIPAIAEINSDDQAEYPLTLSRAKIVYHRLTRKRILGSVAGFVAVTNELAARFAGFGKPVRVIANGIALSEYPLLPSPELVRPTRLVFIGSAGSPWHGLDRVAEVASLIPDIAIDVIGESAATAPAGTRVPAMRFHGPLSGREYEPILRAATAALGTLGLHVKGMQEACPLKVREYLAYGLPVIAAYHDTDVPDQADYFLQLPNSRESLAPHRDRIAAFITSWRGRRVPRASVLQIDAAAKESRRLEFIRQVSQSVA